MDIKILGIIPARSGSKGIPNKNMIDLGGIPLIAHTLKQAKTAYEYGFMDELIVSTDSIKIKSIAENFSVKVPFLRPKKYSNDKSKSIEFVKHALGYYKELNVHFTHVIILQPTSPFRGHLDVEKSIKLVNENNYDSLISCYADESLKEDRFYYLKNGLGIGLTNKHNKGIPRQLKEKVYVRNGAIFISSVNLIFSKNMLISDRPGMYVMEKNRSLDIDSFDDLKKAREFLNNTK